MMSTEANNHIMEDEGQEDIMMHDNYSMSTMADEERKETLRRSNYSLSTTLTSAVNEFDGSKKVVNTTSPGKCVSFDPVKNTTRSIVPDVPDELDKGRRLSFETPGPSLSSLSPHDVLNRPIRLQTTLSTINRKLTLDDIESSKHERDVVNSDSERRDTFDSGTGTPGYQAIQANATIHVSRFQKCMRRFGLPKVGLYFQRIVKQLPHQHKGSKAPILPNELEEGESIDVYDFISNVGHSFTQSNHSLITFQVPLCLSITMNNGKLQRASPLVKNLTTIGNRTLEIR